MKCHMAKVWLWTCSAAPHQGHCKLTGESPPKVSRFSLNWQRPKSRSRNKRRRSSRSRRRERGSRSERKGKGEGDREVGGGEGGTEVGDKILSKSKETISKHGFGTQNTKNKNKSDKKGCHEMPYGSIVAQPLLCCIAPRPLLVSRCHCTKKFTGSV